MEAEVKRWGNSFAVRLTKAELDRLGLKEGDRVEIDVRKARKAKKGRVSLEGMPIAHDDVSDVSERHDEYLYGGRS